RDAANPYHCSQQGGHRQPQAARPLPVRASAIAVTGRAGREAQDPADAGEPVPCGPPAVRAQRLSLSLEGSPAPASGPEQPGAGRRASGSRAPTAAVTTHTTSHTTEAVTTHTTSHTTEAVTTHTTSHTTEAVTSEAWPGTTPRTPCAWRRPFRRRTSRTACNAHLAASAR